MRNRHEQLVKKNSNYPGTSHPHRFRFPFGLGISSRAARDTHPADPTRRAAITNTGIVPLRYRYATQRKAPPADPILVNKLPLSPRSVLSLLAAALVLGAASIACAGSAPDNTAGEPPPQESAPLPDVNPTAVSVTAQPALPEKRYLKLEFPPRIRAGDSDIVRLTLEVDDKGNIVPTAEVEGNVVTGKVIEIPNLYETHHVIAEARFDIAGVDVRPTESISTPISQGQAAVFYWSVRPNEVGVYRGTIWLYLRFVDKVSGEESQKTVSAQIVELEAANFLGLSANLARSTGVVGSIVGTILGFPFFEDIVKFLAKKRVKK